MSDDVLVKVDNVSKRFCRSLKRSLWYGLQDLGSEIGGRRHGEGSGLPQSSADVQLRQDEFWAVKDVSFELRRGECLGLLGRNGAGKSTLLKIFNGLIKPDIGSVDINGSVSALIALGAGFNPILSGRENIYINASILGVPRLHIRNLINSIIDFSGIGEFIDAPVQSYSSGMQMRLGFAIASSLKPDILFVDEVLAVGDHLFRMKCLNRINELKADTAIIFVSHNENQLKHVCTSGIVLEHGNVICNSDNISRALACYYTSSSPVLKRGKAEVAPQVLHYKLEQLHSDIEPSYHNKLTHRFSFILVISLREGSQADFTLPFSIRLTAKNWKSEYPVASFYADILVYDDDLNLSIEKEVPINYLNSGSYAFDVEIVDARNQLLVREVDWTQIEVSNSFYGWSPVVIKI